METLCLENLLEKGLELLVSKVGTPKPLVLCLPHSEGVGGKESLCRQLN